MTTLMRWNPWEELAAFERDAQRMVRSFLEPMERVAPVTVARRHDWVPACDIVTRGEDLVVRFELPGIDPEKDLELTVEDGVLCVKGERRFDDEDTGPGYYRR
ncbi:MAG TPA: Hsp20 family protein, partial [Actinomycetota bacterium]|nr:Hsp20 family protein [Actinomycetota bacterium]